MLDAAKEAKRLEESFKKEVWDEYDPIKASGILAREGYSPVSGSKPAEHDLAAFERDGVRVILGENRRFVINREGRIICPESSRFMKLRVEGISFGEGGKNIIYRGDFNLGRLGLDVLDGAA